MATRLVCASPAQVHRKLSLSLTRSTLLSQDTYGCVSTFVRAVALLCRPRPFLSNSSVGLSRSLGGSVSLTCSCLNRNF